MNCVPVVKHPASAAERERTTTPNNLGIPQMQWRLSSGTVHNVEINCHHRGLDLQDLTKIVPSSNCVSVQSVLSTLHVPGPTNERELQASTLEPIDQTIILPETLDVELMEASQLYTICCTYWELVQQSVRYFWHVLQWLIADALPMIHSCVLMELNVTTTVLYDYWIIIMTLVHNCILVKFPYQPTYQSQ